jgi:hypothetical protein
MKAIWMSCLVLLLIVLVACGGSSSSGFPVTPPAPNNAGYSNASLKGTYVFNLRGVGAGNDVFAVAGVFTADGNGNITSGQEDVNDLAVGLLQQDQLTTGTYSIGIDGRGQAKLTFLSGNVANLQFVLVSSSKARVIELSGSELSSGVFELQDSTALAALTGPAYVLRMDGYANTGAPISRVGSLTASGGTGSAASVVLDENYNGTFTPTIAASSTFNLTGTSGRGTLQFVTTQGAASGSGTTLDLVFYVVNSTRIEFLSINTAEQVSGYADAQSGTFTTASVGSPNAYAYAIAGSTVNGNNFITETGSFTLNSGSVTNGLEDFVDGGSYSASVAFAGSYSSPAANNGRFTGSFTTSSRTFNFVLWFSSTQSAVLMATSEVLNGNTLPLVESGLVTLQPAVPTAATVSGNYALHLGGVTSNVSTVLDGQLLADGVGTFTGLEDFNQGGSVTVGASAGGSYSVAAGRGSGTIGGIPVVFYPASSSTIYVMSTDGRRMLGGSLETQH